MHSLLSFTTDAELTPADLDTLGITNTVILNFPLDFTSFAGASKSSFTSRQNEPHLFVPVVVNPPSSIAVRINSEVLSDCDNTTNDCSPPVVSEYDIFSQTLIASDIRIIPFIVGIRGFCDSLISNKKLTYELSYSGISYLFTFSL